MEVSNHIILSNEDKHRIIKHFESLKDTYATDVNGYSVLKKVLDALEKDELNKELLQELHDIDNGAAHVRMIVRGAYNLDTSDFHD